MDVEAVSIVERPMREDSIWIMGMVDDRCEGWSDEVRHAVVGLGYCVTRRLGRGWVVVLVEEGERECCAGGKRRPCLIRRGISPR